MSCWRALSQWTNCRRIDARLAHQACCPGVSECIWLNVRRSKITTILHSELFSWMSYELKVHPFDDICYSDPLTHTVDAMTASSPHVPPAHRDPCMRLSIRWPPFPCQLSPPLQFWSAQSTTYVLCALGMPRGRCSTTHTLQLDLSRPPTLSKWSSETYLADDDQCQGWAAGGSIQLRLCVNKS
jgi:hypothetical protein